MEIMWFHEGQKAFPLSPERFAQQLDAVAETLNEWRVQNQVSLPLGNRMESVCCLLLRDAPPWLPKWHVHSSRSATLITPVSN